MKTILAIIGTPLVTMGMGITMVGMILCLPYADKETK